MENLKHTPGPWTVMADNFEYRPKEIITGVGVELSPPGYWRVIVNTILPESDADYIMEHEEIKANACLIAAAPEMLKALKVVRGLLSLKGLDTEHPGVYLDVCAAINKATNHPDHSTVK